MCHDDFTANKTSMTSCFMHVYNVGAPQMSFLGLQVQYDASVDHTVPSSDLKEGDSIENIAQGVKLTFKGANAEQSLLTFEQETSNQTETF